MAASASATATSLHILNSTAPAPGFRSDSSKLFLKSSSCYRRSRFFVKKKLRVCYCVQDGGKQTNGEEPPESLFMKELRRRGMNPTSLVEDMKRTDYGKENEMSVREADQGFSKRNAVSTEIDQELANQRERSIALNSEGLEGLIPRAKLLLTLGGTFFLAFWPLILITVAVFSGLYFVSSASHWYFGSSFVHDGTNTPVSPPQYVDPYALLEDERISQIAPNVN